VLKVRVRLSDLILSVITWCDRCSKCGVSLQHIVVNYDFHSSLLPFHLLADSPPGLFTSWLICLVACMLVHLPSKFIALIF